MLFSDQHADTPQAATDRRRYDIVLYGATGFVGRQTVAYVASHPQVRSAGLRWALAGRNRDKLERVRRDCGGAALDAAVLVAGADDTRALNALARQASVLLSTAGPFDLYGSKLVAACVRHGTHYVDITGETPWVQGLIAQHHDKAARDGTRIIPCCGFDPSWSHFDPDFKAWLGPFFMGPVNTRVVRRNAALLGYGPGFQYQEYLRVGTGAVSAAAAASLSTGMGLSRIAMGWAPVRALAARMLPQPGAGPSIERMDSGAFRCDFVARGVDGRQLTARVCRAGPLWGAC